MKDQIGSWMLVAVMLCALSATAQAEPGQRWVRQDADKTKIVFEEAPS